MTTQNRETYMTAKLTIKEYGLSSIRRGETVSGNPPCLRCIFVNVTMLRWQLVIVDYKNKRSVKLKISLAISTI